MEKKHRVLFVDDEALNLRAFSRAFGTTFEILTARSGQDALALLRTESVDVVVVDHVMPQMNGIVLIRRIRAATPSLPCILLTARSEFEEVIQASREGIVTMVVKIPWNKDELERWLVQVTRISSMQKAVGDLKDWHRKTTVPTPTPVPKPATPKPTSGG